MNISSKINKILLITEPRHEKTNILTFMHSTMEQISMYSYYQQNFIRCLENKSLHMLDTISYLIDYVAKQAYLCLVWLLATLEHKSACREAKDQLLH